MAASSAASSPALVVEEEVVAVHNEKKKKNAPTSSSNDDDDDDDKVMKNLSSNSNNKICKKFSKMEKDDDNDDDKVMKNLSSSNNQICKKFSKMEKDDDNDDDKVMKNLSSSNNKICKKFSKMEKDDDDVQEVRELCDEMKEMSKMMMAANVDQRGGGGGDDYENVKVENLNPLDVRSRCMGRYLQGEMSVEEFFLPEKDRHLYYLPHDHYQQDDEMPVFDLSGIHDLRFLQEFSAQEEEEEEFSSSCSNVDVVEIQQQHDDDHDEQKNKKSEMGVEELICRMGEAARTWGFFGVVNHGVSLDLVARMRAQAYSFFQLSAQEKLKGAPNEKLAFAYFPGNPSFHPSKCWNEALQLESNPDKLQLFCDSVWSQEHDTESFRADFLEYTAAMRELAGRILVLLAKSLGLDPNQFKKHVRAESRTTLRMNHYPPCPHPDKVEGLYAHTDASMISIVHQDLVGGLQILKDNKWVGVRPNPASFVVNIGEAMMMMSNERFSSVMHRAVANSSESRLSMAFFCVPVEEDVLTVAENLTDASHPAKFIPFIWKEYMAKIWRTNRPDHYRRKGSTRDEDDKELVQSNRQPLPTELDD